MYKQYMKYIKNISNQNVDSKSINIIVIIYRHLIAINRFMRDKHISIGL